MGQIIKVGLCAYGMSGRLFHAPFLYRHPGFDLRTIARRSDPSGISLYPETKIVPSVGELIQDPDIDLIVVNSPVQTHYQFCKEAILAGKDVLVEKPFVVYAAEAEELIRLADEHQVKLSVFQNRRWDRDFIAVKDIIDKGVLGRIHEAEIRFDRFRPTASGKIHKEAALPGAGALYDLGSHLVDQAVRLFGNPDRLFADLAQLRADVESDDYFELLFYYNRNLRVRIISDVMVREPGPGYILHGDQGSFIQQRSDAQEATLLSGVSPSEEPWQTDLLTPDGLLHALQGQEFGRVEMYSAPGNYYTFFSQLYDYLTGQGPNPVDPQDALLTTRLIEKSFESSASGKVINLHQDL